MGASEGKRPVQCLNRTVARPS
uniref:Uncharacterized protein n=1 Tax=Anguilla anguilla TaxID=7936 RepID=A0A0E9V1Y5_ANGAN